jgi:hypothetical protein
MTTSQVLPATLLALSLGLGLAACSEAGADSPAQPTLDAIGKKVTDSAQQVADIGLQAALIGAQSG